MVITTEAEYNRTMSEINRLLRKREADLSLEEDRLLDLLSTLAPRTGKRRIIRFRKRRGIAS